MKPILLAVFCTFFTHVCNAQLPENYASEIMQSGYVAPMGTIFSSDGEKMFTWTQSGQIYVSVWDGAIYIKQETPALDISDEVSGYRDFGLLSICLHPNFDTNGLIYLFYTVDRHHLLNSGTPQYNPNTNDYFKASISRVTSYELNHQENPMTTNYSSRNILIGESITTGIPLMHESHAGGTLVFGSDGTLLLTTGDNASYITTDTGNVAHTYYQQALTDGIMRPEENVGALRSQMVNSLCGKVLRLDPSTGDGIPSNPFYDVNEPRAPKSRVYGMGLRNPFRATIKTNSGSIDPAEADPGMLVVVDVGWSNWEDMHIFDKPGLNAGWPLYEGQLKLDSYFNSGVTNVDESDQLYRDLCVQPTSFADDSNAANRRFTHSRPSITWKHGNTNQTRVPWFNGTTPTDPRIGTNGAPTTGVEFRGNTGVAGTFISGTLFGADLENKLLFSDYVRNWVGVATFNTVNSPWINNVSQFAPINFGEGIVHIVQNPIDGSVYYTNIFDGTIRRFSFYDSTLGAGEYESLSVVLFPNPIKDQFRLYGIVGEFQIQIYTLSGQLLISKSLQGDVNLPISLASGVYIVKINQASGQNIIKKLVVK